MIINYCRCFFLFYFALFLQSTMHKNISLLLFVLFLQMRLLISINRLSLVACFATLHPALSVCRSVCQSVGHTLLFFRFLRTHATGVAVYPALFQIKVVRFLTHALALHAKTLRVLNEQRGLDDDRFRCVIYG